MADGKYNIKWDGLLIIGHSAMLVVFGLLRLVDGDEGIYLSAAREVSHGLIPYIDFFYPQMPYLPYLFSLFSGWGFASLILTRLLSVLAGVLTILLFYVILRRICKDPMMTTFLLMLYTFSGLIVFFHPLAKPFVWANLFLLASFYFISRASDSYDWKIIAMAGVAAALAVNMRLTVAPAAVLFLVYLLWNKSAGGLRSGLIYFAALLMTSLPAIFILIRDRERFLFDNIGFHFIRNPLADQMQSLIHRLITMAKMLINPQILILLILTLLIGIALYRNRHRISESEPALRIQYGAAVTAIVLVVVHLLPDPVHQQYFVQAVPFVLLAAPAGLNLLTDGPDDSKERLNVLPKLVSAIYLLALMPYIVIFVGGVRRVDGYMTMSNIRDIAAYLSRVPGDDPILSERALIPVLAGKPACRGMEFIGWDYPFEMTPERKEYYHLATNHRINEILEKREASHLVAINHIDEPVAQTALANYEFDTSFGAFQVYRRID